VAADAIADGVPGVAVAGGNAAIHRPSTNIDGDGIDLVTKSSGGRMLLRCDFLVLNRLHGSQRAFIRSSHSFHFASPNLVMVPSLDPRSFNKVSLGGANCFNCINKAVRVRTALLRATEPSAFRGCSTAVLSHAVRGRGENDANENTSRDREACQGRPSTDLVDRKESCSGGERLKLRESV
jgi:hypothetical protein